MISQGPCGETASATRNVTIIKKLKKKLDRKRQFSTWKQKVAPTQFVDRAPWTHNEDCEVIRNSTSRRSLNLVLMLTSPQLPRQ